MNSRPYRTLFTARLLILLSLSLALGLPKFALAQTPGFDVPLVFGADPLALAEEPEFSATLSADDDGGIRLQVTATLPAGCYIYSMNPSFDAATKITVSAPEGVSTGKWSADRPPKSGFDEDLGQEIEKFYDKVTWTATLAGPMSDGVIVKGSVNGLYCNSMGCFPIQDAAFEVTAADLGLPSASAPSDDDPSVMMVIPEIGAGATAEAGAVQIEVRLSPADAKVGDTVTLSLRTQVRDGWHIFALDQDPEMAGLPTEISAVLRGLEAVDATTFTADSEPEVEEPLPGFTQRVHYGLVTWSRQLRVTDADAAVDGSVRFQICSNGVCKLPTTAEYRVALQGAAVALTEPETSDQPAAASTSEGVETASVSGNSPSDQGLITFLFTAITAGFLALATPCVFPMIPITVAFFLKQEEKQAGSSLKLAVVYCLSIIAAFTILGIAMARIFGEASLTGLANNPWLNVFFSVLFIVFALMLLGAFEISVPTWLLNWTSSRESSGGMIGVVFMALTFTLVSFTCTFAFVGSLLVIAAQGDFLWPVLGMLGFSTAFASPFFVLAMFPGMLKQMPRSGGWMNEVKFVIGLVELAAVVKFASVADIGFSASGIPVVITYNVFLVLWILLSAVAGLYLLGLRPGAGPKRSGMRLIFVLLFLGFAGRLSAGLAGIGLPADPIWNLVAAFAPPEISDGDVQQVDRLGWVIYHHELPYSLEYVRAIDSAKERGLPLFLEITGINCVNCRKMERTVLARKDVVERLRTMVLSQVYLDSVPGIEDKEERDTLLQGNKELATNLLGDVTMPSYAIVSSDGKRVLARFAGLDSSGGEEFIRFLEAGQQQWEKVAGSRRAEQQLVGTDR